MRHFLVHICLKIPDFCPMSLHQMKVLIHFFFFVIQANLFYFKIRCLQCDVFVFKKNKVNFFHWNKHFLLPQINKYLKLTKLYKLKKKNRQILSVSQWKYSRVSRSTFTFREVRISMQKTQFFREVGLVFQKGKIVDTFCEVFFYAELQLSPTFE